jgi:ABC-2 type transport system permease protein
MIALVMAKEVRAVLRDGRLMVMAAVLLVALVAILLDALAAHREARAERERIIELTRAQWDHQGAKHPHRAAHFGLYAFAPAMPLATLEPGIGPQLGQALWLEPHKRNMARFSPSLDAPASTRLSEATVSFVLVALVPLLIVGMGHHTVTQERESGTLRLLVASGASAQAVVLGKLLGLMVVLGLLAVPALAGAWWLGGGQSLDGDTAARAVATVATLMVGYLVFVAIAVLASLWLPTGRSALIVLLVAWMAVAFAAPRLGAVVAERAVPVADGSQFWRDIARDVEEGLPGDGTALQRQAAFDAALLRENGVSRMEDLPFGAAARRRIFRDAYAHRVHDLHFDRLWNAWERQQTWFRAATAWSPVVALRSAMMAFAGTDLAHHRAFEVQAESYRKAFTLRLDEWDLSARAGVVSFEERYGGDAVWQSIAPFRPETPRWTAALRAAAPDLLILLAWATAAVALLLASGRRVRP